MLQISHFCAFCEMKKKKIGEKDMISCCWLSVHCLNSVVLLLCFAFSVFLFMVKLGGMIERSQLWPDVKNYFHMVYWVLNYRPGVVTQPANCESSSLLFPSLVSNSPQEICLLVKNANHENQYIFSKR